MNILTSVVTMVSRVECLLAPNCSSLNRETCKKTSNTCGGCLQGYVGSSGDHNSMCLSNKIKSIIDNNCHTDSDCSRGQICESTNKMCSYKNKLCTADCSRRGTCFYYDTISFEKIVNCSMNSGYCQSQCSW